MQHIIEIIRSCHSHPGHSHACIQESKMTVLEQITVYGKQL